MCSSFADSHTGSYSGSYFSISHCKWSFKDTSYFTFPAAWIRSTIAEACWRNIIFGKNVSPLFQCGSALTFWLSLMNWFRTETVLLNELLSGSCAHKTVWAGPVRQGGDQKQERSRIQPSCIGQAQNQGNTRGRGQVHAAGGTQKWDWWWGYPLLALRDCEIGALQYLLHIALSFLGTEIPFTAKGFLVNSLPAWVNFPLLWFTRWVNILVPCLLL